jgi:hypothetical protein
VFVTGGLTEKSLPFGVVQGLLLTDGVERPAAGTSMEGHMAAPRARSTSGIALQGLLKKARSGTGTDVLFAAFDSQPSS